MLTRAALDRVYETKLVSKFMELGIGGAPIAPTPPTEAMRLAAARAALADLGHLLLLLERACPGGLEPSPQTSTPSLKDPDALKQQFADLPQRLADILGGPPEAQVVLNGPWRDVYLALEAQAKQLNKTVAILEAGLGMPGSPATPGPTPVVAGFLRVAGMTEVKVVRHHVERYQGAELAHIENVLQGEHRNRRFRTLQRREEDTTTETETSTTEEKEIKTEDRSSLKSSVDEVLKENIDLKVGFDLQAKVGEVTLGLNTSFAFSRSKDETKREAAEFAKDVTHRASRKATEIARTSIKTRLIRETEETVDHGFDAKAAEAHITGLYQWIEKIHRVQMFTVGHGARAIVDGVLLQPGQRLLGTPIKGSGGVVKTPPPELDVTPSDIHPWSYMDLAAKFGATSVSAPPPLTQTVSISAAAPQSADSGGPPDKQHTYSFAQDIALPEGTAAAYGTLTLSAEIHETHDNEHAIAAVGPRTFTVTGREEIVKSFNDGPREVRLTSTQILDGERGLLPFTVYSSYSGGYSAAAEITCVRTQESYEAWQLGVYSALRTAQAKARQDYDEQVARTTLEQAYQVGPSPGRVESVVREELKRCAIAVLATKSASPESFYQKLDDFYNTGAATEVARRVLFFEQALEWENMTYVLYPYFWADGRNDGWARHTSRDEKDALLVEFLKAGAARIVVPVRPLPDDLGPNMQDFEAHLKNFSLPELIELVDVDSPLYLAIAAELKARDGAQPETFEEEWEVRVPTDLVRLRAGAELPRWVERKDPSGNPIKGDWIEENVSPVASAVGITGTPQVGQVLMGEYTYADTEGDLQGASTFRWLRDNVAIASATAQTYTLVAADQGTMVSFEVTPVAQAGTSPGIAVVSAAVGPVAAPPNV